MLTYWNASGDTDTIFTACNYSGAAQNVVLTLEHQEGNYEMPIHLAPHASLSFSVGALIRRGAPDRNGQVIPPNIVQGSARIAGLTGSHKQRLSVVVTAGIFNSRTGTCSYACFFCIGGQFADFSPDSLSLPMTNSGQLAMMVTFTNGDDQDYSSNAALARPRIRRGPCEAQRRLGAAGPPSRREHATPRGYSGAAPKRDARRTGLALLQPGRAAAQGPAPTKEGRSRPRRRIRSCPVTLYARFPHPARALPPRRAGPCAREFR